MVPRARRFAVALGHKRGFVRKSHSRDTKQNLKSEFLCAAAKQFGSENTLRLDQDGCDASHL